MARFTIFVLAAVLCFLLPELSSARHLQSDNSSTTAPSMEYEGGGAGGNGTEYEYEYERAGGNQTGNGTEYEYEGSQTTWSPTISETTTAPEPAATLAPAEATQPPSSMAKSKKNKKKH